MSAPACRHPGQVLETCGYCDGMGGGDWCDSHQSGNCPCAHTRTCKPCEGRGHFVICHRCDADGKEVA